MYRPCNFFACSDRYFASPAGGMTSLDLQLNVFLPWLVLGVAVDDG